MAPPLLRARQKDVKPYNLAYHKTRDTDTEVP